MDRKTAFDGRSADAIVVLGFSSRLNVWLAPGVDDGVNWRGTGRAQVTRVRPSHGFVVARVPARTGKSKYAVCAIGDEMTIDIYGPTDNAPVWIFNAAPGQVTYVGALGVVWSHGRPALVEDDSVTQDDADDYITKTFPNIPVHVAAGRMESIYMGFDARGCIK